MKTILYTISFLTSLLAFGFVGCHDTESDNGFANEWYELDQKPGHPNGIDNIEDIYGVVVGAGGSIGTSVGRPPNVWTMRTSGTTQNLNGVKIGNSSLAPDMPGDTSVVYAVGNNATVLRSTDRGYTWVNRSIPNETTNLYGVATFYFSPGTDVHAVVCGDSGRVLRSNGSGNNWQWYGYYVGVFRKLNSIHAGSSGYWVAVGDRGAVYKTLNGGETWQNLTLLIGDTNSFNKIVAPQYDRLCIVGNNGKIYTSSNYGISWVPRNSNTTNHLRDVLFSSVDSGVAVGDNGTVRITTNSGVTWFSDSYFSGLTTRDIISISQVDGNTCNSITRNLGLDNSGADTTFFLAVSSEPFLGIEPISNFIADIFSLKQNYPNPFNPVTNIEISVPEASFVKLIIYDIQGREIETLVNQELRAGAYKIDWNASSYPSGVYFYTILADDYKETKKMVLVK